MATSCNIRVMARFRPLSTREKAEKESGHQVVQFPEPTQLILSPQPGTQIPFTFDRVFHPDTHQEEIFEVVQSTIDDVLNGYNGTIFAFGQTGSGKTYTMFGTDDHDPEHAGIIPRTNVHIFNKIAEDTSGSEFTIKCSFLEIYMENIIDLLNPKNKNLKIRESKSNGVWIEGLTEEFVSDEHEIMNLIALGEQSRSVSKTNMNQRSSRSHSLLILTIEQKSPDGSLKKGKLNLVDLAGSEKVGKTGAEGQTLEEAKKINQSLSLLGNCIHALTESKRDHIPFRDSKLTRILQESLGGNTKTTLMVTGSPHISNVEETISTLKFGARAKTIKNSVKVNSQKSAAELLAIINVLTGELSSLKNYSMSLEKLVELMKSPDYVPGTPLPDLASLLPRPPSPAAAPVAAASASTPKSKAARNSVSMPPPGSPSPSVTPSTSGRSSSASNHAAPAGGHMYDPLEIVGLKMQIDRIKEEHQSLIDQYKDELAEINLQSEGTREELEGVRAQLDAAKDAQRVADAESRQLKDVERDLKLDNGNQAIQINSLTSQVDDLKLLASQVIQYLERKRMTDYLEGEANNNEYMTSRTSLLDGDGGDGEINIEEVIRNLSEEECLSMQIKLQLQNRIAQLEQRQAQLMADLASVEATVQIADVKVGELEKERKEINMKLQSMIENERIRQIVDNDGSNSQVNGQSNSVNGDRPTLQHTESIMSLKPDQKGVINELRIKLEQSESVKRSLEQYNSQLQDESSLLREKEIKLNQEIKVQKTNGDKVMEEFNQLKEDSAMKYKIQQNQIQNLQNEVQSLQSKLHNEKQNKHKAQSLQIEFSTKINEIEKKYQGQADELKLELTKKDKENQELLEQYEGMLEKCQTLQEELTTAQRLLMNRKVVKVLKSDEKSMKRAYETKVDIAAAKHSLKKTGKQLF
eukprot:gene7635-8932_t